MPQFVVGQRSKLELVSATHGAVRAPLVQTFDFNPAYTERKIYEFDNPELVATVELFDGMTCRFSYLGSDNHYVEAMLNDADPGATVTLYNPAVIHPMNVLLNAYTEDTGLIFRSVLIKQLRAKGVTNTEPVREEENTTIDGTAIGGFALTGAAILYSRILAAVPDMSVYEQDEDNSRSDLNFGAMDDADLSKDAVTVPNIPTGDLTLLVLKNGVPVTTGYTIVSSMGTTTFSLGSAPATTDVWEVYTAYIDS